MKDAVAQFNDKIEYLIIGEKVTSYRCPCTVLQIKEWEGKICIETKNIRDKYVVFDATTFKNAIKQFNNIGDNNNDNNNKKT